MPLMPAPMSAPIPSENVFPNIAAASVMPLYLLTNSLYSIESLMSFVFLYDVHAFRKCWFSAPTSSILLKCFRAFFISALFLVSLA